MDMKRCHSMAGSNQEKHQQCPKPWKMFLEKCEKLKPVWSCHKECWHSHAGHACHAKCPLPECPKLAGEVQEAEACHQSCGKGNNHLCHHACPRPMNYITR